MEFVLLHVRLTRRPASIASAAAELGVPIEVLDRTRPPVELVTEDSTYLVRIRAAAVADVRRAAIAAGPFADVRIEPFDLGPEAPR